MSHVEMWNIGYDQRPTTNDQRPTTYDSRPMSRKKENVRLLIEHIEEELSQWLFLEYKHSTEIWLNSQFNNLKNKKIYNRLKRLSSVDERSVVEFADNDKTLVLDPQAELSLKPTDFENKKYIVVGGILGNNPMLGRTKKYISDKLPNATKRNLGKKQLSIDSTVFVARLIYEGIHLEEIELTNEVELKLNDNHSIILPYAYPVIDDTLIITPGLIKYLVNSE